MQLRSEAATADMYARKAEGQSLDEIASAYNKTPGAVYRRLNRAYGPGLPTGPANDNNPLRVTRMSPHNGGCSTVSGLMPVSVRRVPIAANDNFDEADLAAGQIVTDYALKVAA